MSVEALKGLNLVDFLTDHYSMEFTRHGQGYVSRSPFGDDRNPSFFVRVLDGRWLFKDFSSGLGGSIIDFVQHMEGLHDFPRVVGRIEDLLGTVVSRITAATALTPDDSAMRNHARGYDVETLYQRFRRQEPEDCRKYLSERGIAADLVEELISSGDVVLNRHQGRLYCCFAVRDAEGALRCLDNHEIGGNGKFVLGAKSLFSLDWPEFAVAKEVFVCEGVIDYLSVKTLEGGSLPGLAVLGKQLLFAPELLANCERIISAFDDDRGGDSAVLDLMGQYPDKEVKVYDLQGYNDPNELLQAGGKKRRLAAEEKLVMYREFQRSDNKSALAVKWRIDRSHMYKVVKDCEKLLLAGLSERSPGRPPEGVPTTLQEAREQVGQLREDLKTVTAEHAKSVCREEFLGLRLKWSEIEAAELRGDKVDEKTGSSRKPHVKKKRKKRRSR